MTNPEGLEVEADVDKVEAAPSSTSFWWDPRRRRSPASPSLSPTTSYETRRNSSTRQHRSIRNHRIQVAYLVGVNSITSKVDSQYYCALLWEAQFASRQRPALTSNDMLGQVLHEKDPCCYHIVSFFKFSASMRGL